MKEAKLAVMTALMLALAALSSPAFSQSTTPPSATTPPAATPTPPPTPPPSLSSKDLEGFDVFGSEGQQLGKVAKVNVASDGKVKDVEVQGGGLLGFFTTTYVVPADKLAKKAGRIELSMTSEQAKQLAR